MWDPLTYLLKISLASWAEGKAFGLTPVPTGPEPRDKFRRRVGSCSRQAESAKRCLIKLIPPPSTKLGDCLFLLDKEMALREPSESKYSGIGASLLVGGGVLGELNDRDASSSASRSLISCSRFPMYLEIHSAS